MSKKQAACQQQDGNETEELEKCPDCPIKDLQIQRLREQLARAESSIRYMRTNINNLEKEVVELEQEVHKRKTAAMKRTFKKNKTQ